jgi:hypothetical protein
MSMSSIRRGGTKLQNSVVAAVALQNEEDVSHGNTRNLFSVSVGTTSSMHLM